MRNHTRTLTLLLALCVFVVSAGTAFAQDPYRSAGERVQGNVQGGVEQPDDGQVATTVSGGGGGDGALPFTGLDVALILAVGGVLVAVGLGTRRLTRPADTV